MQYLCIFFAYTLLCSHTQEKVYKILIQCITIAYASKYVGVGFNAKYEQTSKYN